MQIAEATVFLAEASSVIVHNDAREAPREFDVELISGTAVLSEALTVPGEIVACGARVRLGSEKRGVVQVRLVSPKELVVFAQVGPAEISFRGETGTVPEGKSYRVILNPSDGGASPDDKGTKSSGKRSKALLIIALAAVAAGTIILTTTGKAGWLESPDRP